MSLFSCCNENTLIQVVFRQQKFTSLVLGLEVQGHGTGRLCVWWEPASRFTDGASSLRSHMWKGVFWGPFYKDTNTIPQASALVTQRCCLLAPLPWGFSSQHMNLVGIQTAFRLWQSSKCLAYYDVTSNWRSWSFHALFLTPSAPVVSFSSNWEKTDSGCLHCVSSGLPLDNQFLAIENDHFIYFLLAFIVTEVYIC